MVNKKARKSGLFVIEFGSFDNCLVPRRGIFAHPNAMICKGFFSRMRTTSYPFSYLMDLSSSVLRQG
jgi:hypothetical protein